MVAWSKEKIKTNPFCSIGKQEGKQNPNPESHG